MKTANNAGTKVDFDKIRRALADSVPLLDADVNLAIATALMNIAESLREISNELHRLALWLYLLVLRISVAAILLPNLLRS